jgi:hypothetical protein
LDGCFGAEDAGFEDLGFLCEGGEFEVAEVDCCFEAGAFCFEGGFLGLQGLEMGFVGGETGGVAFEVGCEVVDCFGEGEEVSEGLIGVEEDVVYYFFLFVEFVGGDDGLWWRWWRCGGSRRSLCWT